MMGTTAFVIETSQQYMLNGAKEWKKIKTANNSGGGSSGDEIYDGGGVENNEDIYDGGGVGGDSSSNTPPSNDDVYEGGGV